MAGMIEFIDNLIIDEELFNHNGLCHLFRFSVIYIL